MNTRRSFVKKVAATSLAFGAGIVSSQATTGWVLKDQSNQGACSVQRGVYSGSVYCIVSCGTPPSGGSGANTCSVDCYFENNGVNNNSYLNYAYSGNLAGIHFTKCPGQ